VLSPVNIDGSETATAFLSYRDAVTDILSADGAEGKKSTSCPLHGGRDRARCQRHATDRCNFVDTTATTSSMTLCFLKSNGSTRCTLAKRGTR